VPPEETCAPGATVASTTVELLNRARAGDRQAINQVFDRAILPLKRWASGRLPRWARGMVDTDDLVQDTLMRTLGRLDVFEYREDSGLTAYLRQAVMNRIKNELRRVIRKPAQSLDPGVALQDDALSPLEALLGKETVEAYDNALGQLEPADRELIIGRVELGLSFAELATASGRPSADAARMAVGRAIVKLAARLEDPTVRN
jgi:RNA polymerase sigma-70 factor (ECF subfamily)